MSNEPYDYYVYNIFIRMYDTSHNAFALLSNSVARGNNTWSILLKDRISETYDLTNVYTQTNLLSIKNKYKIVLLYLLLELMVNWVTIQTTSPLYQFCIQNTQFSVYFKPNSNSLLQLKEFRFNCAKKPHKIQK